MLCVPVIVVVLGFPLGFVVFVGFVVFGVFVGFVVGMGLVVSGVFMDIGLFVGFFVPVDLSVGVCGFIVDCPPGVFDVAFKGVVSFCGDTLVPSRIRAAHKRTSRPIMVSSTDSLERSSRLYGNV